MNQWAILIKSDCKLYRLNWMQIITSVTINKILTATKSRQMKGQKRIQKYQFSLQNAIGSGSYATVYKGKIIGTSEEVAIKVIDKKLFLNAYNLKNIQSEIEIMKQVNHQNIVKLHDIYQTQNNMYIITEYCQGGDLLVQLRKRKTIAEAQAKKYLKQIMKGAKYLHSKGIIHRDLKPANILLKGGVCKLSDFGFAKSLEEENAIMKSIVGTPLYMSPQLLQRGKYTNKSDLWSIGLIFYEMIHGRTPWPAKNELQLINGINGKPIIFSRDINNKTKSFIQKCLQIREQDRMSWEQAFDHPLLSQKGTVSPKDDKQNYINSSNVSDLTTRIRKDLSQLRLKKVEALTPKHKNIFNCTRNSNVSNNQTPKAPKTPNGKTSKLKTILAVTPQRDLSQRRKVQKDVSAKRFK